MKNKLISFVISVTMLITCFSAVNVFAAETNNEDNSLIPNVNELESINKGGEKISIAFKIGDSTLKINGENVTVTTPYEKNGTTLVPVRVITEAFGATVDWDDAEQKVTLTYGEVVIQIWIDSTKALVNNIELSLLLAPELTNDTTMVPLRFITENFGADVSYDDATESILVEKFVTESNGITDYSSILHNTEKEYVGDSYHGWSMKYSSAYNLSYRDFSGTLNLFKTDDENSTIAVMIYSTADKTESEIFEGVKDTLSEYTVMVQKEEKDASGNNYLYCEAKSSKDNIAQKILVKDSFVFTVIAIVSNDASSDDKNLAFDLTKSFDAYANSFSNVADLSEVKDNQRIFESKDFNFKASFPADIRDYSDPDKINEFVFQNIKSEGEGLIYTSVSIQSKDNESVSNWIENDYTYNKELYNPDYAQFSEIQSGTLAGNNTEYYTFTATSEDKSSIITVRDMYFELGDYVYNVAVRYDGKSESEAEKIIDSFEFSLLDKSKVGSLMITNILDSKTDFSVNSSVSFSASKNYLWRKPDADSISLYNPNNNFEINISLITGSTLMKAEDVVTNLSKNIVDEYTKLEEVRKCTLTQIGNTNGYIQVTKIKDNNNKIFMLEVSSFTFNKQTFYIVRFIPSIYYGSAAINELNEIVSSFKTK